jgi:hypothetical protein
MTRATLVRVPRSLPPPELQPSSWEQLLSAPRPDPSLVHRCRDGVMPSQFLAAPPASRPKSARGRQNHRIHRLTAPGSREGSRPGGFDPTATSRYLPTSWRAALAAVRERNVGLFLYVCGGHDRVGWVSLVGCISIHMARYAWVWFRAIRQRLEILRVGTAVERRFSSWISHLFRYLLPPVFLFFYFSSS